MEFLKRKHFSLLTITTMWIILLLVSLADHGCYGLQGVPTWMCLGVKSPFIEFKAEIEILANTSVSLNITKDDQALMHEQGLQKLGTFIKPIDLRNSTTGYVKSNLTKKVTYSSSRKKGVTEHPITEEMNRKEIELIEEEIDPNSEFPGMTDDQKYIIPMALKNPSNEQNKKRITTTTTTKSPQMPQQQQQQSGSGATDFSTNIDDLKNHILMLQNMTKNDKNFQSKFVVFPSLQRDRSTNKTETLPTLYSGRKITPTKSTYLNPSKGINLPKTNIDNDRDQFNEFHKEKITIVPQVLLLNDQTPNDEDVDRTRNANHKEVRVTYSRRRNFRKTTTTSTTTTTTTIRPSRRTPKRQRTGGGGSSTNGGGGRNKNKQRQQNCKNLDTPKCQRQKRRQMAALFALNSTKITSIGPIEKDFDIRNTTNYRHDSDSFRSERNTNYGNIGTSINSGNNKRQDDDQKLSRSVRSHHNRRNAGGGSMKSGNNGSPYDGGTATRDFIIPVGNMIINNQSMAYKENIDLNPDLCYKVGGLTYGQQKLCVLHTSIMPAISRGARSAIQECKHQFKNRRWNCSTTEDNTVFGPMSTIGSPEMAFIHALAAATVTSFIARACRDGQLASCGCSRSSRPKQLHDDWTWGGCGDDLEFAYKFSQNFVDIREKERKRGIRGLVSVPQKNKLEEKLLAESSGYNSLNDSNTKDLNNGTSETLNSGNKTNNISQYKDDSSTRFKPEDLLELQEKITKEILNSKLQEKEMLELQEKINREILNSKVFNLDNHAAIYSRKHQRAGGNGGSSPSMGRMKNGIFAKARSLMNLHNNEAGRRAVIKKTRITCKCHGVSGSCSLITCWQQLSSIREIGDYLREKYDEATEVKLNKRGRLTVKDTRYKVPTAHDLVYLDESPDWCRNSRQLQWPGTHGRVCNKTSSGLDGCAILCCGRGYNTKNIIVRERCNCKFHWCCQVKCEICVKVLEEHTCK